MSRKTKIAGRDVPIHDGDVVIFEFSEGQHGKSDAGKYEFWTAVKGNKQLTARWPKDSDPGERFRKMEVDPGYEKQWEHASTCEFLRPATIKETEGWLDGHRKDAKFVVSGKIGGRKLVYKNRLAKGSPK